MENESIAVLGLMISPLYAIIIYRLKAAVATDKKVTKLCTFLKMKYPEYANVLD